MNNLPRQKLLEIVGRYGHALLHDPRRSEGLMRDNFPAHRREIAVLTTALEERIPVDLLGANNGAMPRDVLLARLARRLHDDVAMEDEAARWAVNTWALALGVISQEELAALEIQRTALRQTSPPAQPVTAAATPAAKPPAPAAHRPRTPAPTRATQAAPYTQTSFVVAADGTGDFRTINDAIRVAPEGSRLLVRPGIYHEGFVLDKQLEIIGDGVLEGIIVRATQSSCVVVRADVCTLRNLSLRGQARRGGANDAGFFAVDIEHGRLLLEACDISSDSLSCVAIHNSTADPIVRRCRIHHGVDSGIFAFDGARGTIEGCDIFENANIGIALSGARTRVAGCHVHDGGDAGIVVWNRAAVVIEDCEIYRNASPGVAASDEGNATLRRCRIHEGRNTGVFIHRNGLATLEECNIHQHAESEVAATSGGEVRLSNCQIHHSEAHGVFAGDGGTALLEKCDVFYNRDSGVHVGAGGTSVVRLCRINSNNHVGVSCEAGGAVDVAGCDLTENRVAAWQTDHGSVVKSRNNRL